MTQTIALARITDLVTEKQVQVHYISNQTTVASFRIPFNSLFTNDPDIQ